MKISICSSIQFTPQIKEISEELKSKGHEVIIPDGAERIISGELTLEQFIQKLNKARM